MSMPKKPTGPVSPKGPIKPVAKPAIGGLKKPVVPKASKPAVPAKVEVPKKVGASKDMVAEKVAEAQKDKKEAPKSSSKENKASENRKDKPVKEVKSVTPPPSDNDGANKKKGFGFMDFLFLFVVLALLLGNVYVHHIGELKYKGSQAELEKSEIKVAELQTKLNEAKLKVDAADEELTSLKEKGIEKDVIINEKIALNDAQKRKIRSLNAAIYNLRNKDGIDQSKIDSLSQQLDLLNQQLLSLSKSNEIKALEIQTLKKQIAEGLGPKIEELVASDVSVVCFEEKKGEAIETNKSKKVSKMEINFFLDQDSKIKEGLKSLFFVVKDGEGSVVGANGTVTLKQSGNAVDYSFNGHVDYPMGGTETKTWVVPEGVKMKKGDFKLEIYSNDMLIGGQSFSMN